MLTLCALQMLVLLLLLLLLFHQSGRLCPFEIFDFKSAVTLKTGLGVRQCN